MRRYLAVRRTAAISALFFVASAPCDSRAADVTLLGPASFRVLLPKLLPQFEKASGNNVVAEYAPLGVITDRVINGEAVDVAIVSSKQNEELRKKGKLLTGSRVEIAQVGFTVFIKKGAPKPDLSSADALRHALLSAKSIAVGDPARGGGASFYTAGLLKRLDIFEETKANTRLEASGTEIAEAVAKGDAELGIGVASDLSLVPGIEAVALPIEVQSYSLYVAGVNADSKHVEAAKALIAYLTSPGVKQALAANGFEPGPPETVKLAYFTKQPIIEMAQKHGFFAAENLQVVEQKTAGSTLLFKNLRDGVWDIGLNVADNTLQFRLNPGNPLHMTFPVVIFARIDNGAGASLMTRPEIKTCADARGKTFAVDAPASGYAYIGYQILRNKCHFEPGADYHVVTTGGTDKRYADLISGSTHSDMVLIHTGLPERAEAKGMTRFGTMLPDAVTSYAGVVVTATREWLDTHNDVAIRFLRALKRSAEYVVDPAHKPEILAILPSDGDPVTAEHIYSVLLNEANGGIVRGLRLDPEGLLATAELRQAWGGWEKPRDSAWVASPMSGVYDMSYLDRASLPR